MYKEILEFKDDRSKKQKSNHRFPLIRLLALAIVVFLIWHFNLFSTVANTFFVPKDETLKQPENWELDCKKYKGTPIRLRNKNAQCSWLLNDSLDIQVLPTTFLRYVASLRVSQKSKLHWVAPIENFMAPLLLMHEDESTEIYLNYLSKDSIRVWVSKTTGCKFPGVCPKLPLEWSALSISEGFDFEGQESLLAMDVFSGIGEAPIHPVLKGKILDKGKDSSGYFVEMDHGYNITSKTSGMGTPNESLKIGSEINTDTPLGRLLPKDTATFYLSVRLNGLFVRWEDFYAITHPVQPKDLADYEKNLSKELGI